MANSKTVTVKGIDVKWMSVIEAKFPGYCDDTGEAIKPGDMIAFKHKSKVSDWLAQRIWGRDERGNLKKYHLQVLLHDVEIPDHKPNEYQKALFDAFFTSGDNLICPALAGCTKTSSMVWIAKICWEKGWTKVRKFLYLAFNKTIEEELSEELRGTGVPARTTHSYGYSLLKRDGIVTNNCKPKNGTVIRGNFIKAIIAHEGWDYSEGSIKAARKTAYYRQMRGAVCELAGYIKNWAILPFRDNFTGEQVKGADKLVRKGFTNAQVRQIDELIDRYNVTWNPPVDNDESEYVCTREDVVNFTIGAVLCSIPASGQMLAEIDFDDMLYLPLVLNLKHEKYDCIFTDETQDFCAAQIEMFRRMLALGGRGVVVGDENQAIYGFRGADSEAWNSVTAMIKATGKPFRICMLPLNYRCDQIVIKGAQSLVPLIQGASKARGTWGELSLEQALERANNNGTDVQLNDGIDGAPRSLPTDKSKPTTFAFIGRINSVLFSTFYMLFKQGKKCHIKGYDHIGRPVISLIEELCGEADDPHHTARITDETEGGDVVNPGLLTRLDTYLEIQAERFQNEESEAALEQCHQRVDCVKVIIDNVKTDAVADVLAEIKRMFSGDDDPNSIAICSGHRCKGLEWDVVFVLRPDLFPFPKTTGEEQLRQEMNLLYVVWTRAKKRIYNVVTWPRRDDPKGKHGLLMDHTKPDIEGYERYQPMSAPPRYESEYGDRQVSLKTLTPKALQAEMETQALMAEMEGGDGYGLSPEDIQTEQAMCNSMAEADRRWESNSSGFVDDGKPF